jgi:hypothetical protein
LTRLCEGWPGSGLQPPLSGAAASAQAG